MSDDQKAQVFIFVQRHSQEWKEERRRIEEEANRKRSEAAKEQPRGEGGRFAEEESEEEERVLRHFGGAPGDHTSQISKAKASAAGVAPAAIARAEAREAARPDLLAEKSEDQVVEQSVPQPGEAEPGATAGTT